MIRFPAAAALAAAALLTLLSTGCAHPGPEGPGPERPGAPGPGTATVPGADRLVGHTFLSIDITAAGAPRPLVPGTRIELRFPAAGTIGAQAGCNHLGGDVRLEPDRLVTAGLVMTEMGCDQALMAQDSWLAGFLGAGPAWRWDGDVLVLESGGTVIRLADRERTEPDRSLVGTRWTLDTIVRGELASSVPAGVATPYLEFGAAGGVTGSTGCNTLRGSYAVRGGSLVFTGIGVTRVGCPEPAGAVQAAVTAVLSGEVRYRIEATRLTLTHPSGAGLGLVAG